MSEFGEPRRVNPHPRLVDDPAHQCPWCDGTGLHGRAAHGLPGGQKRGPYHDGCAFKILDVAGIERESACNGTVEWVPCFGCKASGDIRQTPPDIATYVNDVRYVPA